MRPPGELVRLLDTSRGTMVAHIRALVESESSSSDRDALKECAAVLAAIGEELLGTPARMDDVGGHPYLLWEGRAPSVALLGHFDTIWPTGTLAQNPFRVSNGKMHGPGVLDMKAGLVQGLAAARCTGTEGVLILFTSDEELGSPHSQALIEEIARRVRAVLVLEPASGASLKLARKGTSTYQLVIQGRSAHAGLEPERGLNATVEAARAIAFAARLGRKRAQTTVTPTIVRAGEAINTVPARAEVTIDVRAWDGNELARVENALRNYRPRETGVTVAVERTSRRPPLERDRSKRLFALAQRAAASAGLPPLTGAAVGGGSDGSIAAAVGTATLDGLGAVGAGAHTEHEYVLVDQLAPRAALVAALIEELRSSPMTEVDVAAATGHNERRTE